MSRATAESGLDFFIAHASDDSPAAETLRRALEPHATVFEDSMLVAGVDWDIEIAKAADATAITVVLVSDAAPHAYYQRAEIARAVKRARERPTAHRVIPVYLGDISVSEHVYGLELKTGVLWSSPEDVTAVVDALIASLRDLQRTLEYGPRQAAAQALEFVLGLDDAARGFPPDENDPLAETCRQIVDETIVACAAAAGQPSAAAKELRRVLHAAGMDIRVLVERLPAHDEATRRWHEATRGEAVGDDVETALSAMPERFRTALLDALRDPPPGLAQLSRQGRRYLAKLLTGAAPEQTPALTTFASALAEGLPPLRSNSRAIAVLGSGPLATSPVNTVLRHGAAELCRLPPPDPYFTGRDELVTDVMGGIRGLLARKGSASSALSGHPGVGASAVAIEVVRRLADDFTGGVLYIDLHGLQPGARRSLATTVRLISEALALELDSKTRGEQDLVRACVSRLTDRKVLLLLDNALDASQVSDLAGATSSCAVVVTSRNRIHEHADPGALYRVEPLTRAASVAMLSRFAEGRERDERLFDRIAELCDDIPLALRLFGARMASRPDLALSALADLLESEITRLDYLAVGERAVRSAIKLSYDSLDVDARRVLRVLAAIPAGRVSAEEIARCVDEPVPRAQLLLNRLVDFSLVEHQAVWSPGRPPAPMYWLPELIRLFAAERLGQEERAPTVTTFRRSSVEYLFAHADVDFEGRYGSDPTSELDPGRLHDAVRLARDEGWSDLGVPLASMLKRVYEDQRDAERYVGAGRLLADLQLGSGDAKAAVDALLRDAEQLTTRFEQADVALDVLSSARGLARKHALAEVEPEIVFRMSLASGALERWADALERGRLAVQMFERVDRLAATVSASINNSRVAAKLGDSPESLNWARKAWERSGLVDVELKASASFELANRLMWEEPREAIRMWRESARHYDASGQIDNAATAARNAAITAKGSDDFRTAISLLETTAERYRTRNALMYAATLVELGGFHFGAGDGESAVGVLGQAVTALDNPTLDHPRAAQDDVRLRLAGAQLLHGSSQALDLPELGPDPSPELLRLHARLTEFSRSGVAGRSMRAELEALIGARPSWGYENYEFWLHDHLPMEPSPLAALNEPGAA